MIQQKSYVKSWPLSIAAEHGYTVIPPYDHPHVIAGQGTAAFELFKEVGALQMLLSPCGGGGLLSGIAVAAKGMDPDCKVVGIEPEVADDATRSFRTGTLQTVTNPPTIADGVRTPYLGKYTFPLVMNMSTTCRRSAKKPSSMPYAFSSIA